MSKSRLTTTTMSEIQLSFTIRDGGVFIPIFSGRNLSSGILVSWEAMFDLGSLSGN